MIMMRVLPAPVLLCLCFKATAAYGKGKDEVLLEDFSAPKLAWSTINDDMFGGKSTGTFRIEGAEGVGIYEGHVHNLTRIQGPGFIKLDGGPSTMPDVSTCTGIQLVVRSTTPEYRGFRFSFGLEHDPAARVDFIRGHKAWFFVMDMDDLPEGEFQTVYISFSSFSKDWDPRTGDAIETCQEREEYCPDLETLQDLHKIAILGEGVAGPVHLELKSIKAVGCGGEVMGYIKNRNVVNTYASYEWTASEGNPNSAFFAFSFVGMVVAGVLYRKHQQKQHPQNYYQAVLVLDEETTPQEAGYSLEMS